MEWQQKAVVVELSERGEESRGDETEGQIHRDK
jgi:hypothetical protein